LGPSSWLFTGALYNGYGPPDGFCFDIFCGDDPIMDDPRLHGYNRDKKVADFIAAVRDQVTSQGPLHLQLQH
jgi:lysosomal alpha-mannosidase